MFLFFYSHYNDSFSHYPCIVTAQAYFRIRFNNEFFFISYHFDDISKRRLVTFFSTFESLTDTHNEYNIMANLAYTKVYFLALFLVMMLGLAQCAGIPAGQTDHPTHSMLIYPEDDVLLTASWRLLRFTYNVIVTNFNILFVTGKWRGTSFRCTFCGVTTGGGGGGGLSPSQN